MEREHVGGRCCHAQITTQRKALVCFFTWVRGCNGPWVCLHLCRPNLAFVALELDRHCAFSRSRPLGQGRWDLAQKALCSDIGVPRHNIDIPYGNHLHTVHHNISSEDSYHRHSGWVNQSKAMVTALGLTLWVWVSSSLTIWGHLPALQTPKSI